MTSIYDVPGLVIDRVLGACAVRAPKVLGLAHDTELQFDVLGHSPRAEGSGRSPKAAIVLSGESVVISTRIELFLGQAVQECTVSRGVEAGGAEVITLKVVFPAGYIRYTEPVCTLF